jgi:hypothetical protein
MKVDRGALPGITTSPSKRSQQPRKPPVRRSSVSRSQRRLCRLHSSGPPAAEGRALEASPAKLPPARGPIQIDVAGLLTRAAAGPGYMRVLVTASYSRSVLATKSTGEATSEPRPAAKPFSSLPERAGQLPGRELQGAKLGCDQGRSRPKMFHLFRGCAPPCGLHRIVHDGDVASSRGIRVGHPCSDPCRNRLHNQLLYILEPGTQPVSTGSQRKGQHSR